MKNVKNDTADCKVKIIPLGGLEQIGMNMTAIEYGDSIIVMDCGLAFPGDDMLGIDLVIPDELQGKEEEIKEALENFLNQGAGEEYQADITFDPETDW